MGDGIYKVTIKTPSNINPDEIYYGTANCISEVDYNLRKALHIDDKRKILTIEYLGEKIFSSDENL